MAALRSRRGHYIFALWFLLSTCLLLLFTRLISAVAGWMSTIHVYTWCGPSANLECRFEMCRTRLAGNAGPKKSPKIRHLGTIAQIEELNSKTRFFHLLPNLAWLLYVVQFLQADPSVNLVRSNTLSFALIKCCQVHDPIAKVCHSCNGNMTKAVPSCYQCKQQYDGWWGLRQRC